VRDIGCRSQFGLDCVSQERVRSIEKTPTLCEIRMCMCGESFWGWFVFLSIVVKWTGRTAVAIYLIMCLWTSQQALVTTDFPSITRWEVGTFRLWLRDKSHRHLLIPGIIVPVITSPFLWCRNYTEYVKY